MTLNNSFQNLTVAHNCMRKNVNIWSINEGYSNIPFVPGVNNSGGFAESHVSLRNDNSEALLSTALPELVSGMTLGSSR